MFVVIWLFVCRVVVGFSVGFGVSVVGVVCGGGFGTGTTATRVRGFVVGEELVVFGVGVGFAVGERC